ncbi:hypothetical protein BJY04DRAFT_214294 [Aspergillus karnatakaensis]|uniref:diphthine--ammonia ligase family protein n=1 Tax=Aspergillus karnatakaensis TaxID=1810916 RepID=UPI003CCE19E2
MAPPSSILPSQSQTSPQSLNIIALISGGKDSLYNLLHCIRNGHKIVALANLHPPLSTQTKTKAGAENAKEIGEDDIDSFMYQTIGWNIIPLYESALGIPMYRGEIKGGAVDAGRVYRDSTPSVSTTENEEEDETESLIPLLKRVMQAHPEANALCAGAILSTYQRTRIEDVAGRLGLTPLAWLWNYPFLPRPLSASSSFGMEEPEAGLLSDMAASSCSAKIIKVASGALDAEFLWGDVSSPDGVLRRKIVRGMKRFVTGDGGEDIRGAVLGEGGEYETLAVDGAGFLWKGRIVVPEEGREVHHGEGGVGYLRLQGARVERKSDEEREDGVRPGDVRRPGVLDGDFGRLLDGLQGGSWVGDEEDEEREAAKGGWAITEPVQAVNGGLWTVSNITAPEAGPGASEQMTAIAKKIESILSNIDHNGVETRTTADIVFTTVLLRSMADFPLMNSIYVSLFNKPNPPARATVACGDTLPDGVNVMISMVVDLGSRVRRNGLHVQSRSYWAPANIGPYSQAMSIPLQGTEKVVYIAGQIPLEPASMELVETSSADPSWLKTYSLRSVLSLQHMWRIGTAMEVNWWLGAVAFFTGTDHVKTRARLAWQLWQTMHSPDAQETEEDEESMLDAWDIKYGRRGYEQVKTITQHKLPNFDLVDSPGSVPGFFAVQLHDLPRNSDIEWQGLGYRCDGVKLTKGETGSGRAVEASTNEHLRYSCIEIDKTSDLKAQVQRVFGVYAHAAQGSPHCVIYTSQPLHDIRQAQLIPCKSVWGAEGRELAAGVIIQQQT